MAAAAVSVYQQLCVCVTGAAGQLRVAAAVVSVYQQLFVYV